MKAPNKQSVTQCAAYVVDGQRHSDLRVHIQVVIVPRNLIGQTRRRILRRRHNTRQSSPQQKSGSARSEELGRQYRCVRL
jgi:hypothetical protein